MLDIDCNLLALPQLLRHLLKCRLIINQRKWRGLQCLNLLRSRRHIANALMLRNHLVVEVGKFIGVRVRQVFLALLSLVSPEVDEPPKQLGMLFLVLLSSDYFLA